MQQLKLNCGPTWKRIGLILCLSSPFSFAESVVEAPQKETLPLEELRAFTEVLDRIKQSYVEPISDKALLESAITGMLSELDPHSSYLKPQAFKNLREHTSGEFGGLGIEVGMENGLVKVISPIDDTPAHKAGIKAGDLIIKLNETPVKGLTLSEAIKKMRGKNGTKIMLTIIRENLSEPLEIAITRANIKVKSVRYKTLAPGFGYLRISQFQVNTGKDLASAISKLIEKNTKLKGLVVDLRNNPGGVLQAAVDVSNAFLNEGLIVYTQGRLEGSEIKYSATPGTLANNIPIVILVNGGSASASEIVAGALQDHKRALIVGVQTFGKGSVQTILPLPNNRAIKLTTARYYTPKGRSIQAQGIVPDIIVDVAKLTKVEQPLRYKESDLEGHLENENGTKSTSKNGKSEAKIEQLLAKDYQLNEALNILKGVSLIQQH
ncbi:MAG: S41 family peptidase [Gammaproteobacteria bacterium]|nr:S41 family peptidase [Gammaproteobacteria bacterium]